MTFQERMNLKLAEANKAAEVKEKSFTILKTADAGYEAMATAALDAADTITIDEVLRDGVKLRAVAITGVSSVPCKTDGKVGYQLRGRDLLTNAPLVSWVYQEATEAAPVVGSHRNFPTIHVPKGTCAFQREWNGGSTIGLTVLKALTDSSFVGAPKAMVELISAEFAALTLSANNVKAEATVAMATI